MRNRKNILQHEFIGLTVKVVESGCESYLGVSGTVIDETKNLLFIEAEKRILKIPKVGSTFLFQLRDGAAAVEGGMIEIRSEDRTKRLGKPKVRKRFKKIQKDLRNMIHDHDN